jgi:hypothetical protein
MMLRVFTMPVDVAVSAYEAIRDRDVSGAIVAASVAPIGKLALLAKGAAIFKTAHYAQRLQAAGLNVARTEAVVAKEVAAMRGAMQAGAPLSGRLVIDGVLIEYRVMPMANGTLTVGTIFPVL